MDMAEDKSGLFFEKYPLKKVKKGSVILGPQDRVSQIYFLKKGRVTQTITSKDGETITIHVFQEGSFFPVAIALASKPNNFYFEATTNVEVSVAQTKSVLTFLKENPNSLFDLTTRLSRAIMGLTERLEKQATVKAYQALSSMLYYLTNKFGQKDAGKSYTLALTQTDLASWTGKTRETITRQMKILEKKKIVKYKGRKLIITNLESLKKESEG